MMFMKKALNQTLHKSAMMYIRIRAQMILNKWNSFEDLNHVFSLDPYLPPPTVRNSLIFITFKKYKLNGFRYLSNENHQ